MSKRVVEVPVPSVVVLVGAAGAGKSTFAAATFAPDEIPRRTTSGRQSAETRRDQSATRVAFGILHRELIRRLTAGRLVVVDATNLTESARSAIVRRASIAGAPAVALVLLRPRPRFTRATAGEPAAPSPRTSSTASSRPRRRSAATRPRSGRDSAAEGFAAVHVWHRARGRGRGHRDRPPCRAEDGRIDAPIPSGRRADGPAGDARRSRPPP